MKKLKKVSIRVDEKDHLKLMRMAEKKGITFSDYLRERIVLGPEESTLDGINILKESIQNVKKNNLVMSDSIFYIQYMLQKLINLNMEVFKHKLPENYPFPSNKESKDYVEAKNSKLSQ